MFSAHLNKICLKNCCWCLWVKILERHEMSTFNETLIRDSGITVLSLAIGHSTPNRGLGKIQWRRHVASLSKIFNFLWVNMHHCTSVVFMWKKMIKSAYGSFLKGRRVLLDYMYLIQEIRRSRYGTSTSKVLEYKTKFLYYYPYWTFRFLCPGDKVFQNIYSGFSFGIDGSSLVKKNLRRNASLSVNVVFSWENHSLNLLCGMPFFPLIECELFCCWYIEGQRIFRSISQSLVILGNKAL